VLYRACRAALTGPCRLPKGTRVLVACSGGPDSLALLHVLSELARPLGLALAVAHLDHGLRGKEGAADARFVARQAARLGLGAVIERADARAWMRAHGLSGEAGLRRLRHAFLARAARKLSCTAIALGHTADDQAETVLLRLIRGTGVLGLAAMRPRRGRIVRPLLAARRADVLDFLRERKLKPRVDRTNQDRAFRRNRVRADILPRLAHLNPQIAPALAALADRAAELSDFVQRQAVQALDVSGGALEDGQIRLVARKLLAYHPVVREAVFALAFRLVAGSDTGLTRRHLAALENLVSRGRPGARVTLPGSHAARLTRGRVCFGATRPVPHNAGR
jgi:tRNA(Ile)-lysidine synthase